MAFQNFVCWDIGRVRGVMNTNAELASRDIFLAVHSELPLTMSNPRESFVRSSSNRPLDPRDFLQSFLSDDNRHMQVAVCGDSGSGKSHFIRWLEISIPATPSRYVVSIPRSGISLRGVIELILRALPEPAAKPYRDRLNQTGDERSTPDQLEERLLSCIALTIADDEPSSEGDLDLETELIKELPNLFHDPYLRSYFRERGGVIRQLATQVLSGSSEYLPTEEPREFSVQDLPILGTQTSQMSAAARRMCDVLRSDQDVQDVAVEIINRSLDRAIGQVMNFTGDHLIRLLQDVRRHLRAQGQEMILLVEDLARLQGLDLSLLEALIEEGSTNNELCTLRWAAAVTTGYYERIPDTVKTRMNYVLNMDIPTGGETNSINEDSLLTFSAKYLNAARLDPEKLSEWANLPDDQREEPPVACDSCPHRTVCHSGFGMVDEVGFYPFNRASLLNMLRRLDSRLDERFNPRVLVKDVLAEVLSTYGRVLESGSFPPRQLLDKMGGPKLPPIVGDGLVRQNPVEADRQLAVLELWGNGGDTATDLPEELYVSFGLQKPALSSSHKPTVIQPVHESPAEPPSGDARLVGIRDWGNGSSMQDGLLNNIRPLLFNAVISHIDWDNEGLVQTHFVGSTTGQFRQTSISFRGQLTQPATRRDVSLRIPISDEREELREAAIAIEGLYQFRQLGNWSFQDGTQSLESLGNCLDQWSEYIVQQLKALTVGNEKWDSSVAAVELLAVGAALAGSPSRTPAESLNALFDQWPQQTFAQSPDWQRLYQSILRDQSKLRDIALARGSGTKGGQRGAFIDPSKFLPTLRRVSRRWELLEKPPGNDDLARLYARVKSELPTVAKAEWVLRTDWLEEWRQHVPEGVTRTEVVEKVRTLLNAALENGVGFGSRQLKSSVENALADLERVQLEGALRTASRLRNQTDPVRLLRELGRDRGGNARAAVKQFLPAVRDLLDQLDAAVSNRIGNIDQSAKDLQGYQSQIKVALVQLAGDIDAIGRQDDNAN